MRIFGLEISRQKAAPPVPVYENRGGWYRVLESFTGAWQQNAPPVDRTAVLSYSAVYACLTLIASDISKLRVKLVEQDSDGIWSETTSASFSPVLRKPNIYQTRIQFWETWFLSKLVRGNAYILKERDNRGVVRAMYVLDPDRVKAMVTDDGSVFYQLSSDNMAGLDSDLMVPASEIIHDRMNCLFHPLIGTSPIYAAGVAATQGLNIQNNSAAFFGNRSQPGGILIAKAGIGDDTAKRLKDYWESGFTGTNAGRIAVVGDDLRYQQLTITAHDSQLIEQLKWTAEVVCSTFHVPPYKIGVGEMPKYNNIQSLNVEYYSQCLQSLIESAELCLDEGLGIGMGVKVDGKTYGTEFEVENLLRMDSVTQMDVLEKSRSVMTLNERRRKLDLGGITGGKTVYMQLQDHSIEAIAARDKLLIEQSNAPAPEPTAEPPANDNTAEARAQRSQYRQMRLKRLIETSAIEA